MIRGVGMKVLYLCTRVESEPSIVLHCLIEPFKDQTSSPFTPPSELIPYKAKIHEPALIKSLKEIPYQTFFPRIQAKLFMRPQNFVKVLGAQLRERGLTVKITEKGPRLVLLRRVDITIDARKSPLSI